MTFRGAQLTTDEIVDVISSYSDDEPLNIEFLKVGSRRSPKAIVETSNGKFLLKKRPATPDELSQVDLSHEVQQHLKNKSFPVASIIVANNGRTYQLGDNYIYELYEFVDGHRFKNKPDYISEVGSRLGEFHDILSNLNISCNFGDCFHDSEYVRKKIITTGQDDSFSTSFKVQSHKLLDLYDNSSMNVNVLGIDHWEKHFVHGDWHPGNLLFKGSDIVAVLDFDSVKYGEPIADLANACLQFSIVAGHPNPRDWPDTLNVKNLLIMIQTYNLTNPISDRNKLIAIPDLMIETMISEAILPVAATGYFAHFSGTDFLEMIIRKSNWIKQNKTALTNEIIKTAKSFSN